MKETEIQLTPTERARCGDTDALCRAWLQHMQTWWASRCLNYLVDHEPERAWHLVLTILGSTSHWSERAPLGGIIGNLLEAHPRFLPAVVQEAAHSTSLRDALSALDTSDSDHDRLSDHIRRTLAQLLAEGGSAE